jgi:hypothetical protein
MSNDTEKSRFNGQIDYAIDKDGSILARGWLQLFNGVSTIFAFADAMGGHESAILDNVVNLMFVGQGMFGFVVIVVIMGRVVQRDVHNFIDDTKASTTQDFAQCEF